MNIEVDELTKIHNNTFAALNLLSIFGGVAFFVISFFNAIMTPIAKFSFKLSAFSALYLARTTDSSIFPKTTEEITPICFKRSKEITSEISNHFPIYISASNQLRMFIVSCFPCFVKKVDSLSKVVSLN